MGHIGKESYYLDTAQTVAGCSTCLRRRYGAILVKSDEIISTGYNGASRGRRNCVDLNYCIREALNVPLGERYELCRPVHTEANAIISTARSEVLGATLRMACVEPRNEALIPGSASRSMCRRLIVNVGIVRVVVWDTRTEYRVVDVADWAQEDDSLLRSLRGAGLQKLIPNRNVLDRRPPQT